MKPDARFREIRSTFVVSAALTLLGCADASKRGDSDPYFHFHDLSPEQRIELKAAWDACDTREAQLERLVQVRVKKQKPFGLSEASAALAVLKDLPPETELVGGRMATWIRVT
jgi:hypothetical protein